MNANPLIDCRLDPAPEGKFGIGMAKPPSPAGTVVIMAAGAAISVQMTAEGLRAIARMLLTAAADMERDEDGGEAKVIPMVPLPTTEVEL